MVHYTLLYQIHNINICNGTTTVFYGRLSSNLSRFLKQFQIFREIFTVGVQLKVELPDSLTCHMRHGYFTQINKKKNYEKQIK